MHNNCHPYLDIERLSNKKKRYRNSSKISNIIYILKMATILTAKIQTMHTSRQTNLIPHIQLYYHPPSWSPQPLLDPLTLQKVDALQVGVCLPGRSDTCSHTRQPPPIQEPSAALMSGGAQSSTPHPPCATCTRTAPPLPCGPRPGLS